MAENNRNRQGTYRQPYDWNDDYGRQDQQYDEEPNYTISENRGYGSSGRHAGMNSGEAGWKSRYERELSNQRQGDFSGYNQRRYGREENEYGPPNRGISSGYSDFGGDYSARGGVRNLYDRGNEGINRRDYENSENRLGGANYGMYGDRGRYDEGRFSGQGTQSSMRRAGRSPGYGRADYGYGAREEARGSSRGNYGRDENEDRSWWDRTTDEVSSWFGDEEAERRRERDRNVSGNYRGKGPRNYSRSDERIKEDINDRLSDDPFVDATDIEVEVAKGDVTLIGTVDHRSTKRRAEDLVESVSGVKNVENRLRVMQPASAKTQPTGTSTPESSAPIPGSDRSKTRETSYPNK